METAGSFRYKLLRKPEEEAINSHEVAWKAVREGVTFELVLVAEDGHFQPRQTAAGKRAPGWE